MKKKSDQKKIVHFVCLITESQKLLLIRPIISSFIPVNNFNTLENEI